MEKLDTVVTGLGACIMGLCQSCPYDGDGYCKDRLMRDALGVIKALNEDLSGDLIRLSDLMKFPIRIDHYDTENGNEHFVYGVESVLEYAEYLPKVEAEPVVYCKECKNNGSCSIQDAMNWTPRTEVGEYFCSYGERRTNG